MTYTYTILSMTLKITKADDYKPLIKQANYMKQLEQCSKVLQSIYNRSIWKEADAINLHIDIKDIYFKFLALKSNWTHIDDTKERLDRVRKRLLLNEDGTINKQLLR